MQGFGKRLRERAQELELTDAEVARRASLSPRRYGHYVSDRNEPDLSTLLRLCRALQTTPDALLGLGSVRAAGTRQRLLDSISAGLSQLDDTGLRLIRAQVDSLVAHQRSQARKG